MSRQREGGTALIEFVWLAVLLIVPLSYVLIAVFDVQRAAFGVSAASRSAARAFLQSPDVPTAFQRAQRAAAVALADQDLDGATVLIVCRPTPADCLQPGSTVRVLVRMTQPLPLTPSALGAPLAAITVDSTHVEPFGTFRSARR